MLGQFPLGRCAHGILPRDLRPRSSPTGESVCFDAIDPATGTRQLYVAELDRGIDIIDGIG